MIATVCNDSGKVEVKYTPSHTNHELGVNECRNLPLPASVKEEIQQQFAAGITIEWIMDSKYFSFSCMVNIATNLQLFKVCQVIH